MVVVLESGFNSLERNKKIPGLPGKGIGDMFKGLFGSARNIVEPIVRNLGQKAIGFAKDNILPAAMDFGQKGLNTGVDLLKDAVNAKARGEQFNLRDQAKRRGSRLLQEGKQTALRQGQQLRNEGLRQGRQGLQKAKRQAIRQRPRIQREAIRNLRSNSNIGDRIGSLVQSQLKGQGLRRI